MRSQVAGSIQFISDYGKLSGKRVAFKKLTHSAPVFCGDILCMAGSDGNSFPQQDCEYVFAQQDITSRSANHINHARINAAEIVSGYIICRRFCAKDEMPQTHQITDLLQAWSKGDSAALAKLIPLVDRELKKIAHAHMRNERPGHILQTTALMDEALIKLMETAEISWHDRKHFYSLIARRMHHVLVDYARKEGTVRRGNRPNLVGLEAAFKLPEEISKELPLLHEALTKLAASDSRKANVVELHYFGGFTFDEIAKILEVSKATVERDWKFARSWLRNEISGLEDLKSSEP
jgi:RNA polymerase sigma factor (TIGR02999 family)